MLTALFRDIAPITLINCAGFRIEGSQPAGTDRRIVFSYSDSGTSYYKLIVRNGVATPVQVLSGGLTAENVLIEGNTVDELESVTSVPDWSGMTIYPVIALSAPEGSTSAPTIKLSIVTSSSTAQLEKVEESPVYTLAAEKVDIISVTSSEPEKTGSGNAVVQVRFNDGANWTNYMELSDAVNIKAVAVQFRVKFAVESVTGNDGVKVSSVSMVYSNGVSKVSGLSTNLILKTRHFGKDEGAKGLSFAQCLIRHKELLDGEIKAFAAFRDEIQTRTMYPLGAGTGTQQTISLPDTGIAYKSFRVQVNGIPFADFSVNTEQNELTLTVNKGSPITASYEYGWTPEIWQEMTRTAYQVYGSGGEYASAFQLALPEDDNNKTVSTIKFELNRPEGDVENEILGTATGTNQLFQLPHFARKDTIKCTGTWSYDEETRILTVRHNAGQQIVISYHWTAESPEVYAIAAGWAKSA